MGLLFTTEGTRRVVDTLNTAFDGPGKGLAVIRKRRDTDAKFRDRVAKRKWPAGHLARMLLLLPFDQAKSPGKLNNADTKRWHYFLKQIVGQHKDKTVFENLRDALADAILNTDVNNVALDIVRVTFDHVELDVVPYPIVISDQTVPKVGTVRHITLFTKNVDVGELGSQFEKEDDDAEAFEDAPWRSDKDPWDKP